MSVMVAQENHHQIVPEPGKVITASQSMESVHTVAEEEVSVMTEYWAVVELRCTGE
jgi:hypothetical protein